MQRVRHRPQVTGWHGKKSSRCVARRKPVRLWVVPKSCSAPSATTSTSAAWPAPCRRHSAKSCSRSASMPPRVITVPRLGNDPTGPHWFLRADPNESTSCHTPNASVPVPSPEPVAARFGPNDPAPANCSRRSISMTSVKGCCPSGTPMLAIALRLGPFADPNSLRLRWARRPCRRASQSNVAGGSFTPVTCANTALASATGILLAIKAAISCTRRRGAARFRQTQRVIGGKTPGLAPPTPATGRWRMVTGPNRV